MKTLLSISTFLCISILCISAQTKGYEPGFVVTVKGDTIRGEIKHKSGEEIKERVLIKLSEEEKETVKTEDISLLIAGNETYVRMLVGKESLLLLEMSAGALELYEHQELYLQNGQDAIRYTMYLRRAGETEFTVIKPGGWKKQVAEFISDYTELADELNKHSLEELPSVITAYNQWKEDK